LMVHFMTEMCEMRANSCESSISGIYFAAS